MTNFVDNYPWLASDYKRLAKLSDEGKFPQSLILSGREGVGKNIFSEAIIKYHLCLSSHKPCEKCQSCLWINSAFHPDLKVIELEKEAKQIKVDQIREMIHFCHRASETGKKVVLIKNSDKLNINAANSLLKILEESMDDVTILLISKYPKRLPMTIQSRCQKLSLRSDNYHQEEIYLYKNCPNISEEQLEITRFLFKGAPILASNFIADGNDVFYKKLLDTFVRYLNQQETVFELVYLIKGRESIAIYILLAWLAYLLTSKNSNSFLHLASLSLISQGNGKRDDSALLSLYFSILKNVQHIDSSIKYEWLLEGLF